LKYSRLSVICLIITVIVGSSNWVFSQNQIYSDFEYISPQPLSKYISTQQNIVFRFSKTISQFDLKEVTVFVTGNISGGLPGKLKLTDDNKTFIFKTHRSFVSNETIEVTIVSPE